MMASTGRNEGIDALRGASIVLVVMHHLAIRMRLSHTLLAGVVPGRILDALCWNGYESVFVFFVISGFLITGNAVARWGDIGRPRFIDFYTRRASRILPCLLLLIAVLSFLDIVRVPVFTIDNANQSLPGAIASAVLLYLNYYEGHRGYLPGDWDVLWSLSIEEVFYIGFPVACLLARLRLILLAVLLAGLAASLPFTHAALAGNEIWQEKAYLPGMAGIATGVLAALLAKRRGPGGVWPAVLIVAGLACYGAILFFEDLIWPVTHDATLLLLTCGIATLLLGLHWQTPKLRLPWLGWLQSFGRLSYEIYLSHMFVVFAVLDLFRACTSSQRWAFLLYPVVLALTLSLGWLLARVVSQPAERWLRRSLFAHVRCPAVPF